MIARVHRAVAVLLLCLGVVAVPPVSAGPPTDSLRGFIDRMVAVLDDARLKAPERAADRHRALRALADQALDYGESARRTLGSHWDARSADERTQFVKLFTDLIDQAYLSRLAWDGHRIEYDGETINGREATVKARAMSREGRATPVVFALTRGADGRWRVYDVAFEGMSLVSNYRAQFNKIIRASSYEGLVSRLEAKTGVAAQASTGPTPSASAP
ncbi:MAG TPA: ABC transporter substrate-binding protein [Terriglobales bacterium]|nr:ABC transporter substrate-binding protein [Terriglobales bacterium]